jgi:hypothetical protein
MKNLFNNYFDFIGIENEGFRRIFSIIIVLGMFFLPYLIGIDLDDYHRYILGIMGLENFLSFWFVVLFPSPIIFGIIIKPINWVKDGFNN